MAESAIIPNLADLTGRKVTVMGLGTFGGGAAAVRFLAERGATVRVSDQRPESDLADSISSLEDLRNVDWQLGSHDWGQFADADFVALNPAIPPRHPIVQRLDSEGVLVTSEMNLFWQLNPGRVIAVTGSNGKSTTAALIHSMIKDSGQHCWLGGNIGRSLLADIDQIGRDDWVILELSSFQLHLLNRIQARPDIAVVTNFAPNHLDWHETLDNYRQSKQAILRWQTEHDWCVINGDDPDVLSWPRKARAILVTRQESAECSTESSSSRTVLREDQSVDIVINDLRYQLDLRDRGNLRGRHNCFNTAMALSAATLAGAEPDAVKKGIDDFEPLPHRLQFVGEVDGRKFYNDSIATTPESAIAALNSFDEPVVILAGGYDKLIDLSGFADAISARARAAVCLGQTGSALATMIRDQGTLSLVSVSFSFDEAFRQALEMSSSGDVILLSPGCASYDWFSSFIERGEQFCRLVREASLARSR